MEDERYTKDELSFYRDEGAMLAKEFAADKKFIEDISNIVGLKEKLLYVSKKLTARGYKTFDRMLLLNTAVYLQLTHGINMEITDFTVQSDQKTINTVKMIGLKLKENV